MYAQRSLLCSTSRRIDETWESRSGEGNDERDIGEQIREYHMRQLIQAYCIILWNTIRITVWAEMCLHCTYSGYTAIFVQPECTKGLICCFEYIIYMRELLFAKLHLLFKVLAYYIRYYIRRRLHYARAHTAILILVFERNIRQCL